MSHIHWVVRQNKLEIPRDKDKVNKREIHECDGRPYDPDTNCLLIKLSVVYYESRKWEVKIRLMNEGWCDERLKGRDEESTCLNSIFIMNQESEN